LIVKLAARPWNLTAVTSEKLSPVMTTVVPTGPCVGEKLVTVGLIRKALLVVHDPAGAVTLIGPVVAPAGTVAVICVEELTVNAALVPLNVTDVVPVKFVPVITTLVPTGPDVGAKVVTRGPTAKLLTLVAVPPGAVIAMGPVVAPEGTEVVTFVDELIVNVALVPLKVNDVAPVKPLPLTMTLAPMAPIVGEKLVIAGPPPTVKLLALVAVPPGVVTEIGPVVAPAGTVAVI
jgi:hypothetical protein